MESNININMNTTSLKYSDSDKFFIHFNTPEECQSFIQSYNGVVGHTCCFGKGCHLPNVNSWKEIIKLKNDFCKN